MRLTSPGRCKTSATSCEVVAFPAKESTRVVGRQQVVAQGEVLDHSLAERIQPTPTLDRAEPERLLDDRRSRRARHPSVAAGCQ